MGSGNWIVDNLNSALATWNEKLTEIWTLISTSPEEFKGGGIWDVILNIHDALRAIGYALLVLFFVAGVVKTCGSFTELKRPEVAVKTFVRFALAQGAVTYGLELMMTLFSIAQGAVSTIMDASGLTAMSDTALPDEMVTIIEDVGFLESIPLWAVTLLGSLFIWVLSLVMILTVYSRFFKLYMATAIAPIPLASFAGQPSSSIGVAFIKSYAAICLEGCMIVLACIIFSQFAAAPPAIADDTMAAVVTDDLGPGEAAVLVLVAAIHGEALLVDVAVDGLVGDHGDVHGAVILDDVPDTAAVEAGLAHPLDQNFLFFFPAPAPLHDGGEFPHQGVHPGQDRHRQQDVPDHIGQRVVGVVPIAQQRRHHQRIQQRDRQTEHRGQAEQDGQDQDPGPQKNICIEHGYTPLAIFSL